MLYLLLLNYLIINKIILKNKIPKYIKHSISAEDA